MNSASFEMASLYVGDLHPEVTESMLMEIFSSVAQVYSIHLCRDKKTEKSHRYAFVNFQQRADAERTMELFNFMFLLGRPMRIMWSQRDSSIRKSNVGNLFIKNLEKSIDSAALYYIFSSFGKILSCKVACDENGSRGYGYVHFESAQDAEAAIRRLNGMLVNDHKVFITHFKSRQERNPMNKMMAKESVPSQVPAEVKTADPAVPTAVPRAAQKPGPVVPPAGSAAVPRVAQKPAPIMPPAGSAAVPRVAQKPAHIMPPAGPAAVTRVAQKPAPIMPPAVPAAVPRVAQKPAHIMPPAVPAAVPRVEQKPAPIMPPAVPAAVLTVAQKAEPGFPAAFPKSIHRVAQKPGPVVPPAVPAAVRTALPPAIPPALPTLAQKAATAAPATDPSESKMRGNETEQSQDSQTDVPEPSKKPLTIYMLESADLSDQYSLLYEYLFPLVEKIHLDRAKDITCMIIQGENNFDLVSMINNPVLLCSEVEQIVAMLEAREAGHFVCLPPRRKRNKRKQIKLFQ